MTQSKKKIRKSAKRPDRPLKVNAVCTPTSEGTGDGWLRALKILMEAADEVSEESASHTRGDNHEHR